MRTVKITEALVAYVYSTAKTREAHTMSPGEYIIIGEEQTNSAGEVWATFLLRVATAKAVPLIIATHWGPTPLGKALV